MWFSKKWFLRLINACLSEVSELLCNVDGKDSSVPDSHGEVVETALDRYCSFCGTRTTKNGLIRDPIFTNQSIKYRHQLPRLIDCPFCVMLKEALERCIGANEESESKSEPKEFSVTWRKPFYPDYSRPGKLRLALEIFCANVNDRPSGLSIPIKERIEPSTSSRASLKVAINWMNSCRLNHPRCQLISSNVKFPTRLLSIGDRGTKQLKLIEPAEPTTWVCLTHRWGKRKPKCLTLMANFEDQCREISRESFPPTFQDAVTVTRRLGFHYLWIDCICIIQDNMDDWRRESSYMGDYYSGAALTIAASGAQDCEQGMFSASLGLATQFGLSGGINRGIKGLVCARPLASHKLQAESSNVKAEELPTLSRAWVYQERMLSRRVLHFTPRELQWECRSSTTCQCGWITEETTDPKIEHARLFENLVIITEQDLLTRWARVINEYSQLQLSFSKDKLPALSGIAKQFQDCMPKYQYLAGIWLPLQTGRQAGDLFIGDRDVSLDSYQVCQLLWAKRGTQPLSKRPQPWQAPTWSWSSLHGAVRYDSNINPMFNTEFYDGFKRLVKLLHAETILVSQKHITGQIIAGHLRLLAPVAEGVLSYANYPFSPNLTKDFTIHTSSNTGKYSMALMDCFVHKREAVDDFVAHNTVIHLLRICLLERTDRIISLVLKEEKHQTDSLNGARVFRRIGILEESAKANSTGIGYLEEIVIV